MQIFNIRHVTTFQHPSGAKAWSHFSRLAKGTLSESWLPICIIGLR